HDALPIFPALYLSAGQRRRLSLARLIAAPRPVWLLDEPNSALDDAGQLVLTGIMAEHLGRDGIIVAATHGALGVNDAKELILQLEDQSNRRTEPREARASGM